ncbi:DUF4062 domain-containing protein [Phytopseudomonas punonensis]|uniref:DUF4062 domain-containing protein n=1 Tax=Phytopseudomonas punonensis TaxID=1220495 RepID=A0A1M7NXY9_9GAMM|nr:DUF4062 domain-containing protein [Pseudomonas punonensis]SHN08512.1 protein of unknown function [Pseudomonas punonensis]
MATPRIFVSSTCYDLQEVRFQLRHFISEFGFEPVMSEFGDIFFDLKAHVQDACKNEIEKTDLFVLIIGNSYGSIYYGHHSHSEPDSVTLQEFRKCLEVGVPKYIFINKFLKHDFDNYKRSKAKAYASNYTASKKDISEIDFTEGYNKNYPFPQESYRHIFKFLDLVESLDTNNAYYTFESFDEIKTSLKKQWAALFYDALKGNKNISQLSINNIEVKLEKIESYIELIAKDTGNKTNSKENKKILSSEINKDHTQSTQEELSRILDHIFLSGKSSRIRCIDKPITNTEAAEILSNIEELLKKYKLSKTIPIQEILSPIKDFHWYTVHAEVPCNALQSLLSLKKNLPKEDHQALYSEFSKRVNIHPLIDDEIPF